MTETKIKQISSTYELRIGNYYITATINEDGRISLSHGVNKYGQDREFIFENSKVEVVYAIGTLIRDAADLVSSIPPDNSN